MHVSQRVVRHPMLGCCALCCQADAAPGITLAGQQGPATALHSGLTPAFAAALSALVAQPAGVPGPAGLEAATLQPNSAAAAATQDCLCHSAEVGHTGRCCQHETGVGVRSTKPLLIPPLCDMKHRRAAHSSHAACKQRHQLACTGSHMGWVDHCLQPMLGIPPV